LVSFFNSTNNYIKLMEANVLQSDEVAMEVSPYEIFVDVKSDHQYAKAIEALKDAGVIGGYDDDSFKPEKTISRAEFLSVVANALDADFASGNYFKCFKDVEGQWFEVPVCYAKEKGWVKGGAENYGPTADVLSQEALKMITLAFEFDYEEAEKGQDWYIPFLNSAIDNKVITEKEFTYGKVLSRGQFAELLYKAMVAKDLL
ncbi:MAG: S-layer homology domain-containing protein, partial [Candidatus Gracilibacteria bacterium]